MANHIELAAQFVPLLDEAYQLASLTSVLDSNPELARLGANANELIIPKLDIQGLANYSRSNGYVDGEVSLTHETVPCNFDRGRIFNVDACDNIDSACAAFGMVCSEFIRLKVAPELDAFRFANYASADGIGSAAGTLTDGEALLAALRVGITRLDEAEAPHEDRFLFITPSLLGLIEDLDTTKSRALLARFASIVCVPQTRFYTDIQQLDGTTDGQKTGGYVRSGSASDINFMIIHKDAVVQFPKHIAPKVISPEQNQTADAWKFGYRQVGVVDVHANKVNGIYAHTR